MSAKQLIEVRASHESICLRYRIDHSIQRLYFLLKRIICSPLQEPIMDVRVKREPGIHILSSTIAIPSSKAAVKHYRETLGKRSMDILCKVRLLVIKAIICHPANGISGEKERIVQAGRNVVQFNLIHENIWLRGLWLSLRYGHLHP